MNLIVDRFDSRFQRPVRLTISVDGFDSERFQRPEPKRVIQVPVARPVQAAKPPIMPPQRKIQPDIVIEPLIFGSGTSQEEQPSKPVPFSMTL